MVILMYKAKKQFKGFKVGDVVTHAKQMVLDKWERIGWIVKETVDVIEKVEEVVEEVQEVKQAVKKAVKKSSKKKK